MYDSSLLGRSKELEVAGALIRNGIYVYYPLVDTGADLVAANREATAFIPVQVRYRAASPALNLFRKEVVRFKGTNSVIAFLVGGTSWYLQFSKWVTKAVDPDRRDQRVYVRIAENQRWLAQFEGDVGLRQTFSLLVG